MERARIPRARERVRAYPHELSGGMRQRVMIAMALSVGAKALLADEPTTALDVTVQAQILAQLKELREQEGLGIVLITHDFGVVADVADRIAVMRAGRIVEQGTAAEIFDAPKHAYTRGLLQALRPSAIRRPTRARGAADPGTAALPAAEVSPSSSASLPTRARGEAHPEGHRLLEVDSLRVTYAGRGRRGARIEAVRGVSLTVDPGETLAIVGESGCGKTTLLRSIARLVEPSGGAIRLRGQDLAGAPRRRLAELRRELGMVFQDPQASLNPRRRVGDTLERAVRARTPARETRETARETRETGRHARAPARGALRLDKHAPPDVGADRSADARVEAARLLERVGLGAAQASRFPHELSGGERQRVGIARALAGEPRLVLLDEPVSSLDASLRRGVIELLDELQAELGCAYVVVSHDLGAVEAVADRIAVMHAGEIVEIGPAEDVLVRPRHPYTKELLAARPLARLSPAVGGALQGGPFGVQLPGGVRSAAWADSQSPAPAPPSQVAPTSQPMPPRCSSG